FTVYHGAQIRSYAVVAGDRLIDDFKVDDTGYKIDVHGPNGFHRQFSGRRIPDLSVTLRYEVLGGQPTGNVLLLLKNHGQASTTIHIRDNAYGAPDKTRTLAAGGKAAVVLPLADSHYWYDFTVAVDDDTGGRWTYAGRVETGKVGLTDPQMGHLA